jgi:DNA-binding NarL/FixJ family response regulator
VDKGLLQSAAPAPDRAGFAMLETIRSVALQELAASGEQDDTLARLAAWNGLTGESPSGSYDALSKSRPANLARPANSPLSERESAVLRLVAEGLPSKQIGRQLGMAERTVKAHVTGAMNKLGAFSRAQALGIAVTRGYL